MVNMENNIKINRNPVFRLVLIITGWLFVALGFIGVFLPVMPTTIFLIIAAACFARSSEKFYNWLLSNKYFGKFIRDYREKKGMPLRAKIIAITMLNIVIGYSAFVAIDTLWVKILLIVIAVSVTSYILSIKTLREDSDLQGT